MTFVYPRQCLQLKGQWGPGKWFTQSSNKHSWFQNPYWQKTKQLGISKRGQGDELRTNEEQVQLAVRAELELWISEQQVKHSDQSPYNLYKSTFAIILYSKNGCFKKFFYEKSYLTDFAVMRCFVQFVDKESYNEENFSRKLLKT